MKTVNRRTATRGSRVRFVFSDGSSVTGQLTEWGSLMMSLRPDEGQTLEGEAARRCNGWKRESFTVGQVRQVVEL